MSSFLEEAVGAGLQRGDIADLVARAAGVDVGASLYPKDWQTFEIAGDSDDEKAELVILLQLPASSIGTYTYHEFNEEPDRPCPAAENLAEDDTERASDETHSRLILSASIAI